MILGFTGTQNGMNEFQRKKFNEFIQQFDPDELHHGDCIGADLDAHYAFINYHIKTDTKDRTIVIHPPDNPKKRAFADRLTKYNFIRDKLINCKHNITLEIRNIDSYRDRNEQIVKASDIVIAAPKEMEHSLRSGTWMTIRYCWHNKKQVVIIPPLVSFFPEKKDDQTKNDISESKS
jgi:hypothetical protein